MTHLTQIRGTSDYNGYGYNFVRSLTAAQNLNHADTYSESQFCVTLNSDTLASLHANVAL